MKMTSKYRNFMYLLSIGLIFTLAYAYATTHLNLGGTGSITLPNTNLFAAINGVSASTTCSAISSTSYTDTGLSVTWPTVVQGTSSAIYVCLKNTGSGVDTLDFAPGTLPTGVTFTSPQQGSALGPSAFILSQMIFTATTTATTGSFSFTLAIT